MKVWMKAVCVAAALGVSGAGLNLAIAQDTAPTADAKGGKKGKKDGKKEGRGDRDGRRGGLAKLAMDLPGITPEQKTKLEAIQKENEDQMKAMRSAAETTGTATGAAPDREKRMEAMKAQRAKIEAVLTDAQKTELAGKMEAMRGGRRGGDKPANE